jgi:hypothetical protein
MIEWWFRTRMCTCHHKLERHEHYSGNSSCEVCPPGVCNRFQWRFTKWIYLCSPTGRPGPLSSLSHLS